MAKYDRIDYCGECQRIIDISDPDHPRHKHNGTPLCKTRPGIDRTGPEIQVKFDAELRQLIDSSSADPRDHRNWIRHPGSDGNKGWFSWAPPKEEDCEDPFAIP